MSIRDTLYAASPLWIQNILVSAYGYTLRRRRYGRHYRRMLANLEESQYWPAGRLEHLQTESLRKLVVHCLLNVPYYQDAWRSLKQVDLNCASSQQILESIPILDKNVIRDHPEALMVRNRPVGRLTYINTSGTTGTPLRIAITNTALQHNYAFFTRYLHWAGVDRGMRCATFAGRILVPENQKAPPFWRSNWFNRNVLYSSYHLSGLNIPHYIAALERQQPEFIDSYPSAIFEIAHFILRNGINHRIRPRAIITSSETLLESQRNYIEQAFGCRVFDHFGSAEMAVFITQCERGQYHANPEYGILEILDKNGRPVQPGETGEFVCTGFLNAAMPLVRYRIGDSGSWSENSCPCGRAFPVIRELTGRTDDLIVTADGRKIGRLDPIFKGFSGIKATQIVQESLTNIVIKMVTDPRADRTMLAEKVKTELLRRIGGNIRVDVVHVDAIPLTGAGKFRAVISKVESH